MPYQPGESGNLNGRGKGVPNKATIYKQYLVPSAPELIERGLKLALGATSKQQAMILKVFLERILPKAGDGVLNLGIIAGNFNEKSNKIFDIMSDGQVAVSDGSELIKALALTQTVKLEDFENREDHLAAINTIVLATQQENKELKAKIEKLEGRNDTTDF